MPIFHRAALIAFGGLVFNLGNIAGFASGFQLLTGIDPMSVMAINQFF